MFEDPSLQSFYPPESPVVPVQWLRHFGHYNRSFFTLLTYLLTREVLELEAQRQPTFGKTAQHVDEDSREGPGVLEQELATNRTDWKSAHQAQKLGKSHKYTSKLLGCCRHLVRRTCFRSVTLQFAHTLSRCCEIHVHSNLATRRFPLLLTHLEQPTATCYWLYTDFKDYFEARFCSNAAFRIDFLFHKSEKRDENYDI